MKIFNKCIAKFLFLARTMKSDEEKRKKVAVVYEAFKEKQMNFAELKNKCQREKFAQKMLQKARHKLLYERAMYYIIKNFKKIYRTEVQITKMRRRAGNFYSPTESKLAPQDQRYQ
jgi:hypothetical protein